MNRDEIREHLLETLPPNPHGRLILSPRAGKTAIVIHLIKRDKPKSILWVTPSRKLIEQDIPEEFVKWKAKRYLDKVEFSTYASLDKQRGYYEWIILDEEQHITERNSVNLCCGLLEYGNIISMTGVNSQHKIKKDIYDVLKLSILYYLPLKKANEVVADYQVNVVPIKLSQSPTHLVETQKIKFYTTEEKAYQYISDITEDYIKNRKPNTKFKILQRMRFIYDSKSKEEMLVRLLKHIEGQRNMIFCSSIAQAERLGSGKTFHSKTNSEQLNKFLSKAQKEIYLVNSGGTGFTYEGIDNLVITQVDSNKNGLTTQKIARSLLLQKDYKANIWILMLKGTKDEVWVNNALKHFDKDKIKVYGS